MDISRGRQLDAFVAITHLSGRNKHLRRLDSIKCPSRQHALKFRFFGSLVLTLRGGLIALVDAVTWSRKRWLFGAAAGRKVCTQRPVGSQDLNSDAFRLLYAVKIALIQEKYYLGTYREISHVLIIPVFQDLPLCAGYQRHRSSILRFLCHRLRGWRTFEAMRPAAVRTIT